MNRNSIFLTISLTVTMNHIAAAASDGNGNTAEYWTSAILSFLPILFIFGLLYLFFRRQLTSPLAKLQRQYLERQIQHTQRLEELLERIAKALEKNDDKVV